MDDPLIILAFVIVCAALAVIFGLGLLKWLIRREVRRMLKSLRESKFVMVRRDKSGRFIR